jgi:outer membrane protein OmpA-like peptidoglycan-associated protein
VADELAAAGIALERISAQGLGESRPLVKETKPDGGDDPEGRARNRRVEVVIANAE